MLRTSSILAAGLLALAGCSETATEPDRDAELQEDLARVRAAVESFAADHGGALPESLQVLTRPDDQGRHYLPSGTPDTHDPWGHPIVYELAPDGTFVLRRGEAP
jgi:hypothetical protein